jgi:hypothetical protein
MLEMQKVNVGFPVMTQKSNTSHPSRKTILSTFAEARYVRTNNESMLVAFLVCDSIVSTGQRLNQHCYKEVLQGLTKQVLRKFP